MNKMSRSEPNVRSAEANGGPAAANENSRGSQPKGSRIARWPLLALAVGGILMVLWVVLLGWGAFEVLTMLF
jgi:hypothetical protein